MSTVADLYDDVSEFQNLLSVATDNAVSQLEMEFCERLSDKYDEYGERTYLSERQDEILRKLAETPE